MKKRLGSVFKSALQLTIPLHSFSSYRRSQNWQDTDSNVNRLSQQSVDAEKAKDVQRVVKEGLEGGVEKLNKMLVSHIHDAALLILLCAVLFVALCSLKGLSSGALIYYDNLTHGTDWAMTDRCVV